MPDQSINVFISYSHTDSSLVGPVVQLMRANRSLVFQDKDQITPGKKWREEIERGLSEANMVVVFWCQHASASVEVEKEWQRAIEMKKDVLPLLLDATPLPTTLREYQYIDFRGTVGANHGRLVSAPGRHIETPLPEAPPLPPRARSSRARWAVAGGIAASVVAVVIGIGLMPEGVQGPPVDPNPEVPSGGLFGGWFWAVAAIAAVVVAARALLASRVRAKKSVTRKEAPAASAPMSPVEHQIATQLEAEIVRRGTVARKSSDK